MTVKDGVLEILNNLCGAEEGELEFDLDLFEAGLLDSFGVVQLIVELEERFDISLDIASLSREKIATPALIVRLVQEML